MFNNKLKDKTNYLIYWPTQGYSQLYTFQCSVPKLSAFNSIPVHECISARAFQYKIT